jgi:hypothetical protein
MKRPRADVGTDPIRRNAVDADFVERLNSFGAGASLWPPDAFEATNGYLCPPLDGIWARAPYLHNGSVPSLWDLLGPKDGRPTKFERGNPYYDVERGGFVSNARIEGRRQFTFDTTLNGNSNAGHEIVLAGEGDPPGETDEMRRKALIAYLYTL